MSKPRPKAPVASSANLWVPGVFIAALALSCLISRIGDSPYVLASVAIAVAVLCAYLLILRARVRKSGRRLQVEWMPRPVHYVQFTMHCSVYAYWGWYWREVYRDIPLIFAQILFVYALDALICWSRRDKWVLGFGPVPIVLSTNLFLWFKDEWFLLQFVLVAVGIVGKEFIRWRRDGRITHIFNPSAFSLFLFSVALIATHSTEKTWGIEIASSIHRPPHIYLEIFLLGLVVQALFRVTLVTLSAAVALWMINLWYTGATGLYHFIDSNIPVAVFLGLHLLVTDPATSPRTNLGKIMFGAMYGLSVFGLYALLLLIDAPEFYDKLLCVPPLNLTVRALDRWSLAAAAAWRKHWPSWHWTPQMTNYAFMSIWVFVFAGMLGTGFLAKGKDHPGSDPAFWEHACAGGSGRACTTWVRTLNGSCQSDSGTNCMRLARVLNEGRVTPRDPVLIGVTYGHACDLGVADACRELQKFVSNGGAEIFQTACNGSDGASCFILGSLYSSGTGVVQDPERAFSLFQRSCNTDWWRGCGRLGVSYLVGQGTVADPIQALRAFEKGCHGENGASCMEAARVYATGPMELRDAERAQRRLEQACELGVVAACRPPASLRSSLQ